MSGRRKVLARKSTSKRPAMEQEPNEHGILFRDAAQQARYDLLVSRRVVTTRYLDRATLVTLGLHDDVLYMYQQIGWAEFFREAPVTYVPITLEFMSSLEIDVDNHNDDDDGTVSFRLANEDHILTLSQINQIFGFPEDGTRNPPEGYNEHDFWAAITGERPYLSRTARASHVSNPCFRYVHRVLAHTLFARGESDGLVRQTELLFLWAMVHSCKLNTAFYLIKQLQKSASAQKGVVACGGLITSIATAMGIKPYGMEQARGSTRVDLESCQAMKMITREGDAFSLLFRGSDFTMLLPCPDRTTIRVRQNWHMLPVPDDDTPMATAPPSPSFRTFRHAEPSTSASTANPYATIEGYLRAIREDQQESRQEIRDLIQRQTHMEEELARQGRVQAEDHEAIQEMLRRMDSRDW